MSVDYASRRVAGRKHERPKEIATVRRLFAEVAGTYLLVLSAAAPDVLASATHTEFSDPVKAFMPGMAVAAIIYALGDVSGAHLNPAVTLAFWGRRAFPASRVPGYIAAQVIGGVLACLTLRAKYGPAGKLGLNVPKTDTTSAIACEILLTTILVMIILSVATKERLVGPQAALPVGLTIALDGLLGMHVSGASMNPARSLAPALATGNFSHLAIYLVGPVVGAAVGVGVTWLMHDRYVPDEKIAAQGEQ